MALPGWWLAFVVVTAPVAGWAGAPVYTEGHGGPDVRARAGLPELSKLARSALPAVVGILTTQEDRDRPGGEAMKDLLEHFRSSSAKRGLATGFIVHSDGFIVTNAHVLEGAGRIEIELGDDEDERLPARVIGRDDPSDIALLKVDAGRPLAVLPLGDSDQLQIAEWVMVVGNPFGLSHSVTLGIVSHTGRADIAPAGREGYYDYIQTDASINPGNSGGPLINLKGEVIGIATAINATGQGIGFAVPINMAKEILGQLRDRGRVVRSWMGVSVRELHRQAHERGAREVVVTDVVAGGPAASSGIHVGDVITGFDGRQVVSAARLRWYVSTAGVGRHVALTVRRGADERALRVELGELPSARTAAGLTPPPEGRGSLDPEE
jgi:serine protease Do